ncbi:hypothetical protein [Staphylococcus kloosii]|uniref:hypothetical protein n=1 Tax=Staphylococcus kloosii TaxID=29384 RepID=UPI00189FC859|nr:hypothetical protein [Staphylococcus kloosii]MBF7022505.1 hypothetical protein [Staphylococcus kloosii]
MKIKRTQQFDLIELINYIVKNDIKDKTFHGNTGEEIYVNNNGEIQTVQGFDDMSNFIVNTTEKITEDTLFYHMIEITKDDSHLTWKHTNISEEKDSTSKEFHAYIDGEYKLIWRDGKLIKE